MDTTWVGIVGAGLGVGGTLFVQRLNFRRVDSAVRREIKARFRMVRAQLISLENHIWLPELRAGISAAMERVRAADVAAALTDDQLLLALIVNDELQGVLFRIDAAIKDDAYWESVGERPSEEPWEPSDLDYLSLRENLTKQIEIVTHSLELAIKALR